MWSGESTLIAFRRAVAGDSRRILEWRNDPVARAASFNTDVIPLDRHLEWFSRPLPDLHLYIATASDESEIGYVRFDLNGDSAEISVCLDPDYRHRGLGRVVIRESARLMLRDGRLRRIVALVKPENDVSLASFKAAGFTVHGRERRGNVDAWVLHFEGAVGGDAGTDVLMRVDAGPAVGLGHLQRCLALAAAFSEMSCRVTFLVNDDPRVADRVTRAGWPAERLACAPSWSDADADAVIAKARGPSGMVVVVDSGLNTPVYTRRLRDAGLSVCVVDDDGADDVTAHVLLNGDAHAGRVNYSSAFADTVFLIGPDFAPLPPEYWAPAAPPARVPPSAVLVTLGGADAHGLMPLLLDEATRLPAALRFEIVVGPFTGNRGVIEAAAARLGPRATLHDAPRGMLPLIAACDMALTAAGQTLYELAALGRPAIAIQVAGNQRLQLEAFVEHGAAVSAGIATDSGIAARVMTMLAATAADAPRLERMAAAGRRFIDGQGARRAAAAVLARSPKPVEG
jgi:spore coat polysaccharide biosynthesis predicted glycosyltransferase SpsG/RimJ/RimL family protein N-acetyltransferase